MTTTDTLGSIELEPFAKETMSRDDMIAHIQSEHGYSIRGNSSWDALHGKSTKDDMIEWHDRHHAGIDAILALHPEADLSREGAVAWFNGKSYAEKQEMNALLHQHNLRDYPTMKVVHTHMEPVVDPEIAEAANAVARRDNRPVAALNATQRKALKDVVDNDFNMLDSDIRTMSADMKRQRVAEVEAEWAEKRKATKTFRDKAERLLAKQRKARQEMRAAAEEAGVDLKFEGYDPTIKVEVKGYKEALTEAEAGVKRDEDRARLVLQRQRLAAHRTILLTGVEDGVAQKVLDTIPDAAALMRQAAVSVPQIGG